MQIFDDRKVYAPIFSTLLLGFVEGCIHFRHRPICLRFAIKYTFWNVIPSFVCRTIPARTIASSFNFQHNLLLETLKSPCTSHDAKRVLWIETARCARYCFATFGLLWALWPVQIRSDDKGEVKPIRLAFRESDYVRALKEETNEVHAIIADEDAITDHSGHPFEGTKDPLTRPIQVTEIEWTDGIRDYLMQKLCQLERRADLSGILLYRVGLILTHQFTISRDAQCLDIYFSPAAVLVKALYDHFKKEETIDGIVFHSDECETWAGLSASGLCTALKTRGLNIKEQVNCDDMDSVVDSTASIFAISSFVQAKQLVAKMQNQQSLTQDRKRSIRKSVIVLHESVTTAEKEEIGKCEQIILICVTDLCNQLLRDIRRDLYDGHPAKNVQNKLRSKYGAFNGHFRHDFHSDIAKYVC